MEVTKHYAQRVLTVMTSVCLMVCLLSQTVMAAEISLGIPTGDHVNRKKYIGYCLLALIAILLILIIRRLIAVSRRDRDDD